jgi:hypothetical protein
MWTWELNIPGGRTHISIFLISVIPFSKGSEELTVVKGNKKWLQRSLKLSRFLIGVVEGSTSFVVKRFKIDLISEKTNSSYFNSYLEFWQIPNMRNMGYPSSFDIDPSQ